MAVRTSFSISRRQLAQIRHRQRPAATEREHVVQTRARFERAATIPERIVFPKRARRHEHIVPFKQSTLFSEEGESIVGVRLYESGARHESIVGLKSWCDSKQSIVESEFAPGTINNTFPQ